MVQLDSPDQKVREKACGIVASLLEGSESNGEFGWDPSVNRMFRSGLIKKLFNRLHDQSNNVRVHAAGALR